MLQISLFVILVVDSFFMRLGELVRALIVKIEVVMPCDYSQSPGLTCKHLPTLSVIFAKSPARYYPHGELAVKNFQPGIGGR